MSRDLGALLVPFREKVEELLLACDDSGYTMRPYFTLRDPFEQARLWRQSRSSEEIGKRLAWLRKNGGGFIADCIESVGPQFGPPVTNAVPGLSWHQWGEAVDCFWLLDGHAQWSTRKKVGGINGYHHYASRAEELGLIAGGHWHSLKDWPHIQHRAESSPARLYTLEEIDREMQQRFAG
jgi:peptidoglycan L-alanyl-D-glutamate endopeptidase CwlK